jgi:hypothetical protein
MHSTPMYMHSTRHLRLPALNGNCRDLLHGTRVGIGKWGARNHGLSNLLKAFADCQ